jgi:hypothetical protein
VLWSQKYLFRSVADPDLHGSAMICCLDLDRTRNADPEPGGKKLLTKKEKSFLQML